MMTVREILNLYEYYSQRRQSYSGRLNPCNGQILSSDENDEKVEDAQYVQIPGNEHQSANKQADREDDEDCELGSTHETKESSKGISKRGKM